MTCGVFMRELAKHSEKLNYFLKICQHGSLQAASRAIGVSAPTLSYTMKELEEVVKVKLFTRTSHGMSLTNEGTKLKNFCARYFEEMESLSQELVNPEYRPKRKIKIGIFPSIAIYFWPYVLSHFEDDEHTSISLYTNRSHQLLESLVQREIDIAVTVDTIHFNRMVAYELYEDEYAFYASNKKLKNNSNKFDHRLERLLFIPDAKDENGKTLRQYVNEADLQFKDEFELDSLEVICEFVKQGYGVGILPTRVTHSMSKEIKAVQASPRLKGKFGLHKFYLTHRDDLDLQQKLIDHIVVAARKAVKQMNFQNS